MVAASATSPLTVLGSGSLTAYWRFQRAVVAAQLQAWLPPRGRILVDISGPQSSVASQAAAAGCAVLQVMPRLPAAAERRAGRWAARPEMPRVPAARRVHRRRTASGRLVRVVADYANLAFLADGSVDGVIADDGALSRHLMAEDVAAEIARVLRPGGQLLACVDSLVLGMSILAEQHHWAELTDLPQAEVVLVPWPDGRITRCFGPEQLVDLLTEAGLEVSWIRPRTCCPRPWWITCCAGTRAPSCGWSGRSWPQARRTRGWPGRLTAPGTAGTNRSASTCWPRPASRWRANPSPASPGSASPWPVSGAVIR